MSNLDAARLLVGVIDGLVLVAWITIAVGWRSAARVTDVKRTSLAAAFVVVPIVGILWTWTPLAAWRQAPGPDAARTAAPTLLLLVTHAVALSCVAASAPGRRLLRAAGRRSVCALGAWRAVFGMALLALGMLGGLPEGFFWSASLGDMLVGTIGIALAARRHDPGRAPWLTWNLLGLADLVHVVVLAVIHAGPFAQAHPELPTLNLLPLVMVPTFVAAHVAALVDLAASNARKRSD